MGKSNSKEESQIETIPEIKLPWTYTEPIEKVHWFWQSNGDPWAKNQEKKWQEYLPEHNIKIENAFRKQGEDSVEVGDYKIHFDVMLQFHKQDHKRARRVHRRVDRAEIFVNEECHVQMINNSVNITMELLNKMKKLSSYNVTDQFKFMQNERAELAKNVIKKLTEEMEKDENQKDKAVIEQIKDSLSAAISKEETGSQLCPIILKSFTQKCFLNRLISQHLINNNKLDLEEWASYILLLLYNFTSHSKEQNNNKTKSGKLPRAVYRGALLYQNEIENCYNRAQNPYICWNTFTSASKNGDVVKNFVMGSKRESVKFKTLFTISLDSYNKSKSKLSQLVDLSTISEFQEEEEVLICPGTIFEVLRTELKKNIYYITLRVVPEDEYKLITSETPE